jgi:subtilisin family serine protease
MRRAAALLASLALVFTLVPSAALAAPSATSTWIVTLRDGVDPSSAAPVLARQHGGRVGFVYEHALNGFSFRGSQAAASALLRNANVLAVEADAEVWLDTTQSPATWGLDRIDQRSLPLSNSYTYNTTGAGVTAYVIDSGILTTHNEFGTRASVGADFINDGRNGQDCNGHGTHVAGTIGGTTYGVAKNVKLVSVRVFGCSGGSSWEVIIAGIDWVTANAVKPAVANMSLGGSSNSSVDTATNTMIQSGVPTAVAAGNGNFIGRQANACNYSPARVPAAMTVSATNNSDQKASWANYGDCVDWFAPGVSITSAWYDSTTATNTISGTSMASPHTAGVAALYLEAGHSPGTVRDAIYAATTKGVVTSSSTANNHLLYSLVASSGGGEDTTAPAAPTGLTATGGDASVTLDWADNTESDLAGYNVYRSTTSEGPYTKINGSTVVSSSSYVDTGLSNGTTYYYVVRAVDTSTNESGNSNQASATPQGSGGGGGDEGEFSLALTGTSTSQGSSWTAIVTIAATDATGQPVNGVSVTGSWTPGGGDGCTTNGSGTCTVDVSQHKRVSSVTFTVNGATHTTLAYDGGPDSVTVAKP